MAEDLARARLSSLVQGSLVVRTASARASLWADFAAWATRTKRVLSADSAVLYVMSRDRLAGPADLKRSTLAKYAGDLQAVGRSSCAAWDEVPLAELARLLRRASEDPTQAQPADRDAIHSFVLRSPSSLFAAVALTAWKGAMRIGDVRLLRVRDVVRVTEDEVLLDLWRAKSSGATGRMASDTRFAILAGESVSVVASYIRSRLVRPPDDALFPFDPTLFMAAIREMPDCAGLTQHSFRVGALARMLSLAARGVAISAEGIRIGARHSAKNMILPKTTLHYLRKQRVGLAEFLTAEVRARAM